MRKSFLWLSSLSLFFPSSYFSADSFPLKIHQVVIGLSFELAVEEEDEFRRIAERQDHRCASALTACCSGTRDAPFFLVSQKEEKKRILFSDDRMGNSPSEACFSTAGEEFYNHTDTGMNSTEVQEIVLLDEGDHLLTDDDLQLIHPEQVVLDNQKFATIHYPSRDHPECVEICYSDIACLNPGSYLTSTIMNFYIQYLQKASSSTASSRGEYHFFNTYFYNKLEEAASDMSNKNACFAKLRRWLRGVNIFQKAYLFLPIHLNLHWSLVIICIPAMEKRSGPVILHLDSLGLHDTTLIFGNIERYLKEEWKHIGRNTSPSFPISERTWRKLPESIVKKKIQVPQQKNEYDCGLFVLYFIERFIEDAPERIRLKDLDKFGNKWFDSEEASRLRTRVRELLVKELELQVLH